MILTNVRVPADTTFLFEVYAGTRREEVAAWGWTSAQQELFLRMQFDLQQRSYDLQYPGAEQRLIVHDKQPVGRVIIYRAQSEIRLVDIALLPAFRNQGIGRAALASLQAEAVEAALPLRLRVMKGNPARRLYERLGFSETGENETHFAMEWCPPA